MQWKIHNNIATHINQDSNSGYQIKQVDNHWQVHHWTITPRNQILPTLITRDAQEYQYSISSITTQFGSMQEAQQIALEHSWMNTQIESEYE